MISIIVEIIIFGIYGLIIFFLVASILVGIFKLLEKVVNISNFIKKDQWEYGIKPFFLLGIPLLVTVIAVGGGYTDFKNNKPIYECQSIRDEIKSQEEELAKLDNEWKAARDDAASLGISNSEYTKDRIRDYRKAAKEYEENKQELSENCKKLLGLQ